MTRGLGGHSPSNIAQHLKGIDFPCKKQDLIRHAEHNKASEDILQTLRGFPEQEYDTMADVMKGFGESGSPGEGGEED